jgi:hypothetical protein
MPLKSFTDFLLPSKASAGSKEFKKTLLLSIEKHAVTCEQDGRSETDGICLLAFGRAVFF